MYIPSVSIRNIEQLRRCFKYEEEEDHLHLNYVEPLLEATGKYVWRIEYKMDRNSKYHDPSELSKLLLRIKHRLGVFESDNIYFNLTDRIYMHVSPPPNDFSVSRKVQYDKRDRRRDRDSARMNDFKSKFAEVKTQAENLGYKTDTSKLFSQNQELHRMQAYIRQKTKFVRASFAAPEQTLTEVAPVVEKYIPSCTENINSDISVVNNVKPSDIIEKPSKKILEMSMKSTDKRFIKSRLLSPDIFPVVRRYVSHLCDSGYGFVNSHGETRLSSESMFLREGLPIGKDLKDIYLESLENREFTSDQIETDLQGLKAFEQTSRIIRLQTAREKTRSWYGLKGGGLHLIKPVEQKYYDHYEEVIHISETRGIELSLSDASGELKMFN